MSVVGIGDEGLRSYLKRGLLGTSGLLAPFVHSRSPAPDPSAVCATWRRFGIVDLCLMRLAKQLLDAGLDFDAANSIVSHAELRRLYEAGRPERALVLTWHPFTEYILFGHDDLAHLPNRLADLERLGAVNLLMYLVPVWDEVHQRIEQAGSC